MSTEELPETNNPAELQGRIEIGNKNNLDQENTGETKETIELAKGPEEMVKLADEDISLTLKKAKEDIKERLDTITDHGGAAPEDIAAAKKAGDNIGALNEQDAQIAKKEIGDLAQSDGRLSLDEAQEEAKEVRRIAVKRRAIQDLLDTDDVRCDEKIVSNELKTRIERINDNKDEEEQPMDDEYIKAEEDVESTKSGLADKNPKKETLKLELEYLKEKKDFIYNGLFEKKDMDIELSAYDKAQDKAHDKMLERIESIEAELEKMEESEKKFKDFSASIQQMTTREEDGKLEKGEEFSREDIDFGASLEHLKIHHDGKVAGSQFNNELFKDPQEVEILLKKLLPEKMQYDQYGRAELTLDISGSKEQSIGWTGVKSIEEIQKMFPDAKFEKRQRNSGGVEATENGIKGAWHPEKIMDPKTEKFIPIMDDDGNIKNPKFKFEPDAFIASVKGEQLKNALKTDKLTLIIQKSISAGKPVIRTIFPGDNAQPFPVKARFDNTEINTLGEEAKETKFWNKHAFIEAE